MLKLWMNGGAKEKIIIGIVSALILVVGLFVTYVMVKIIRRSPLLNNGGDMTVFEKTVEWDSPFHKLNSKMLAPCKTCWKMGGMFRMRAENERWTNLLGSRTEEFHGLDVSDI